MFNVSSGILFKFKDSRIIKHDDLLNGSFCRFIFFAGKVSLEEWIFKGIKVVYSSENSQQCPHVTIWLHFYKSNLSDTTRQVFPWL